MPATFDDISALREEWELTLPRAEYRQRMADLADQMQVGQPGRAELLACLASDNAEQVTEKTLALTQAAIDDGGPTTIDPRVTMVEVLYGLGREQEAEELARRLLRSASRDARAAGAGEPGLHGGSQGVRA